MATCAGTFTTEEINTILRGLRMLDEDLVELITLYGARGPRIDAEVDRLTALQERFRDLLGGIA